MAASLLALVPEVAELAAMEAAWRADAEVVGLLEQDAHWDQSNRITTGWLACLREIFAHRGVPLKPAVG